LWQAGGEGKCKVLKDPHREVTGQAVEDVSDHTTLGFLKYDMTSTIHHATHNSISCFSLPSKSMRRKQILFVSSHRYNPSHREERHWNFSSGHLNGGDCSSNQVSPTHDPKL
jgi:hypothetical protein